MKKFGKFLGGLVIVAIIAVCLSEKLRDKTFRFFSGVVSNLSSTAEPYISSLRSDFESALTDASLLSQSDPDDRETAAERSASFRDTLAQLARYFPNGSYFTADASACDHPDPADCGNCRYPEVIKALWTEVWWEKVCPSQRWSVLREEATGSESFAMFLYHGLYGEDLALDAEPVFTCSLEGQADLAAMTDTLLPGDLLHFTGDREHWAVFLERSGINVRLYETEDTTGLISYDRDITLEQLASLYAGGICEVYRGSVRNI